MINRKKINSFPENKDTVLIANSQKNEKVKDTITHIEASTTPDKKTPDKKQTDTSSLDFAVVFQDSFFISNTPYGPFPKSLIHDSDSVEDSIIIKKKSTPRPDISEQKNYKKESVIYVPGNTIRIALTLNIQKSVIYTIGSLNIRSGNKFNNITGKGIIAISSVNDQNGKPSVYIEMSKKRGLIIFLPCTLLALSSHNFFELNENSYRGSIIIAEGEGNTFSIINYCNVEEYLRGVVPLEIGKLSEKEIEAVKAQAIAARTYTYKKMIERKNRPFDMYPTIRDQVYGGIRVENPLCDRAVSSTKGIVLAYNNKLIYAYYHSTCGGKTANIRDVWNNGKDIPYLKSVRDTDSNGKAFCSISSRFTWSESWENSILSSIISRFSKKINKKSITGTIKSLKITGRFSCGRISKLLISTTTDIFTLGGDKIRYILRRNTKNYSLLNSARFEIDDNYQSGISIRIKGIGYGHGIGMCQMGAIGRARNGQLYNEILQVYYPGSYLAHVEKEINVEYLKVMKP